jgi:hypothetical protein
MTGCAREQYLGDTLIEFFPGIRVLLQGRSQRVDLPLIALIDALRTSF